MNYGAASLLVLTLASASWGVGCSPGPGVASTKPAEEKSTSSALNKGGSANTIAVPPAQQQLAGIRTAEVEPRRIARTLTVPGQIVMNDERTAHIAPYSDGKVVDVLKLPGDVVQRGTVLAHLHSHTVHETVGALAQDFANVARQQAAVGYATAKRDRYAHLYAIQAASLEQQQGSAQELVQAQTELANAQAAVTMEREHLGDLMQVPPESITPENLYQHELVPITSPIAGTVMTRAITPGMVLEPGNEAYTVSDLGSVWMIAAVNEADLSHVRTGQHVMVRTDAWPGESFAGTVTLIGSSLDPATRTVQVRATLRNRAGELKPQMFTTATLDEADTREALFVPEDALQEVHGVAVVFVTPDGTHFMPRTIKTLPAVHGEVEVTEGLRAGEHIAMAGAFMLKSELLKGTIGED